MFFINELRPSLNVQSDSIRAKVFNHFNYVILACLLLFLTPFFTFSYFTYFHFFVLYLYLCKIFVFTFKLDNDRSSVETSRSFTRSFYFKVLTCTKKAFELLATAQGKIWTGPMYPWTIELLDYYLDHFLDLYLSKINT